MIYYYDEIPKLKDTIVTIGKFDGIHKGHMKLVNEALKQKKETGYAIVMFELRINENLCLLNEEEKRNIAEDNGIDYMISYPLDDYIKNMTPDEFLNNILKEKLGTKAVIVGDDFRFGINRAKGADYIKEMQEVYGYKTVIISKLKMLMENNKEEIISSTLIKEYLLSGEVLAANKMLGRKYAVKGKIIHGKQLGRTIGFPTINVELDEKKILPANGVYKVYVIIDGKRYLGMADIGNKPTVGEGFKTGLEVNIFDFNEDVYNKEATVLFCDFIRKEKKFSNVEELQYQLGNDKKHILSIY